MPHVFCRPDAAHPAGHDPAAWDVLTLSGEAVCLSSAAPAAAVELEGLDGARLVAGGVLVVRDHSRDDAWVLVAAPDAAVQINGLPLTEGIRVLAHRDEIRVGGEGSWFFSTETLPAIAPFPGTDAACMRCKLLLPPGGSAVRCPGCTLWFHESADDGLLCWTGFDTCANCRRPTAMDQGFGFSPEDL